MNLYQLKAKLKELQEEKVSLLADRRVLEQDKAQIQSELKALGFTKSAELAEAIKKLEQEIADDTASFQTKYSEYQKASVAGTSAPAVSATPTNTPQESNFVLHTDDL